MGLFSRQKPLRSSPFSDFIRKATSGEKKKVYTEVLKKATERQNATSAAANSRK
jgi:hypothetical protein